VDTKAQTAAGGGTLRERRREQTRADTVAGVLAVIDSQGFEKLTIERIATAAGVSRGTVYAHFPGGLSEMVAAAYAADRPPDRRRDRGGGEMRPRTGGRRLMAHARAMFGFAANTRSGYFYNVSGPAFIGSGEARGIGSGAGRTTITEALERAQGEGRTERWSGPGGRGDAAGRCDSRGIGGDRLRRGRAGGAASRLRRYCRRTGLDIRRFRYPNAASTSAWGRAKLECPSRPVMSSAATSALTTDSSVACTTASKSGSIRPQARCS
jgi:AcrR family transcriptional regulator